MNDSVRRIMAEVRELRRTNSEPGSLFVAEPLESDLFEWHFTVRGPPDTPFENGFYHGRILLPSEYPLKAPEIMLLTPNGRFEVGTRICLSVTSYHQETWQPSWGIRTILTALVGFMPSAAEGVGALDYPPKERRRLAAKSRSFVCQRCGTAVETQFKDAIKRVQDEEQTITQNENGKRKGEKEKLNPNMVTNDCEQEAQGATRAPLPATISSSRLPSSSADAHVLNHISSAVPAYQNGVAHDNAQQRTETRACSAHRENDVEIKPLPPHAASPRHGNQEKALLYLAYCILALIAALFAVRILGSVPK